MRPGTAALVLALGAAPACVARAPRSESPGPGARVVTSGDARVFADDLCGPGSLSLVLNSIGDPISPAVLAAALPRAPGGGVLSLDLLLAARQRGFEASLGPGDVSSLRAELEAGRAAILMLKLLEAPGRSKDVYHFVVVDGFDAEKALFRFQFGDGQARWAPLRGVEKAWRGAGRALLRVRPAASDVRMRHAIELEKSGRLDEARAEYLRIVAAERQSTRAWTNLGNVESSLGRRADAEAAYRRALASAPHDKDALNNLAWLLYEEGTRLPEAEDLAAEAAAEERPDRPFALDTLGRIQLARGRCEDAERTFREALTTLPASSPTPLRSGLWLGRGEAEKACGRLNEARASFREALSSDPDERTSHAAGEALRSLPPAP